MRSIAGETWRKASQLTQLRNQIAELQSERDRLSSALQDSQHQIATAQRKSTEQISFLQHQLALASQQAKYSQDQAACVLPRQFPEFLVHHFEHMEQALLQNHREILQLLNSTRDSKGTGS